jgi:hypothetical protein
VYRFEDARELTLSTFSWLQGEWYPGYALLSLAPEEIGVEHCGLPSQIMIYIAYGVVLLLSLASVVLERPHGNPGRCCGVPLPGVRAAGCKKGPVFLACALAAYGGVHVLNA